MRPMTGERAAAEYLAARHLEEHERQLRRDRLEMALVAVAIVAVLAWHVVGP